MKKFGSLSSSVDDGSLSTTVSGLIISFSALIILGANMLGFHIGNADVSNFAQSIGLAIGALVTLYGLVRKIVVAVNARWMDYHSSAN